MYSLTHDALLASHPWEQALFTTYALSLTFFESIILPRLRAQGCRDIWIVADAEGYRASLMERRSNRVGQEYRLIPVVLPRGVFHPKCTYLAGPQGDLLLVGSGNLTFGGYGRNLEVLEALEPTAAPAAFEDFANFLEALRTRDSIIVPDFSWITTFAGQARSAARPFADRPSDGQPRLIHTVRRSALDQISEVCTTRGGGRHSVVLSPFHDADGAAVRRLAEKTGCSRVSVGLSPHEDSSSAFPFARAKTWNKVVEAVRPDLIDENRHLHAKWIEVELPQAKLTLTGSINATTQALCTTNNVEVGVLRIEPKTNEHVRWNVAAIPSGFTERTVREPGLGQNSLVHAAILGDGTLVGRLLVSVFDVFDPSGTWTAKLALANGELFEFAVNVNSSGDFRTPLPQADRFAFAMALQIELMLGERTARGWVQLDEILRMPQLHRASVTSFARLIAREETEDDDAALLDYFAISSSKHLGLFTRRMIFKQHNPGENAAEHQSEAIIDLEAIAPDAGLPNPGSAGSEALSATPDATLERVLSKLRKRLIGRSVDRETVSGVRGISALDDGEDELDETPHQRVETALEHFDEKMREMAGWADNDMDRRAVMVIWFEVSMHMLLRRLKDRDRAVEFLRIWFYLACAKVGMNEVVTSLEQHVFTASVLVLVLAASEVDQMAMRVRLHEALERFSGGAVAEERAISALNTGQHVGFTSLLLDGHVPDLEANLLSILGTRTHRQDLQEAMNAFHAGLPPDSKSRLFLKDRPYASALHKALSRPAGKPNIREQRTENAVCAHCFVELSTRAAQDLEDHRIAQCTSCRRITVRLQP